MMLLRMTMTLMMMLRTQINQRAKISVCSNEHCCVVDATAKCWGLKTDVVNEVTDARLVENEMTRSLRADGEDQAMTSVRASSRSQWSDYQRHDDAWMQKCHLDPASVESESNAQTCRMSGSKSKKS